MAFVRVHWSSCRSVFSHIIHLLPKNLSDLSGHSEWNKKWKDD